MNLSIDLYYLDVNPGKLALCPTMTRYLEKWSSWSLEKGNTKTLIICFIQINLTQLVPANKHQKLVSDEDKTDNKILTSGMKTALIEDAYIRVKRQLEELIRRQDAAVSTLNFWDKIKYR